MLHMTHILIHLFYFDQKKCWVKYDPIVKTALFNKLKLLFLSCQVHFPCFLSYLSIKMSHFTIDLFLLTFHVNLLTE